MGASVEVAVAVVAGAAVVPAAAPEVAEVLLGKRCSKAALTCAYTSSTVGEESIWSQLAYVPYQR